ncbi:MAG: hypothetical protein ABSE89_09520 [Sedimentisphaerales bacterium]
MTLKKGSIIVMIALWVLLFCLSFAVNIGGYHKIWLIMLSGVNAVSQAALAGVIFKRMIFPRPNLIYWCLGSVIFSSAQIFGTFLPLLRTNLDFDKLLVLFLLHIGLAIVFLMCCLIASLVFNIDEDE